MEKINQSSLYLNKIGKFNYNNNFMIYNMIWNLFNLNNLNKKRKNKIINKKESLVQQMIHN